VKMAECFVSMGLKQSKLRKFRSPPQPLADYHLQN